MPTDLIEKSSLGPSFLDSATGHLVAKIETQLSAMELLQQHEGGRVMASSNHGKTEMRKSKMDLPYDKSLRRAEQV